MKPDYELIGRWLGNRQVEKEIGYPVYNDPETRWIVLDGVGFLTYRESGHIDCLYVEPAERMKGNAAQMVKMALEAMSGRCMAIRVSANENSFLLFQSFGFQAKRRTKNFMHMERRNA